LRLLLDEHYAGAIAYQLRAKGFDAVTVSGLGRKGTDDEPLLEYAVTDRRALLTNNVADFMPLHAEWMASGRSHFGLLFTDDASMPRHRSTIGRYVSVLTTFMAARPGERDTVDQIHWPRG